MGTFGDLREPSIWLALFFILGVEFAVLQAPLVDGLSFDPFPFEINPDKAVSRAFDRITGEGVRGFMRCGAGQYRGRRLGFLKG